MAEEIAKKSLILYITGRFLKKELIWPMDKTEADNGGKLIVIRLKAMTLDNKIVWILFHSGYHTIYRDISFKIMREEDGWILCACSSFYNISKIVDSGINDIINAIKEQDATLSDEKRREILSDMLGKGHLQTILDILGQ